MRDLRKAMIKAAIFDLDGTLYDYDAAHAVAWRALSAFAEDALGVTPERFDALHRDADRLLRQRAGNGAAIHNRLIRYQLMLELLREPIALAPEMADLYWSALVARAEPLPGATEALDALRSLGLVVGVGTNMTADWQYAKLRRLDMLRRVDFLVTSEEAGAEKPDARLFRLCAEKAGCAPSECAFVGDSLKKDALGARDAGMRAVWLCAKEGPVEPVPGVTVVRSLRELPKLIPSLEPEGVGTP